MISEELAKLLIKEYEDEIFKLEALTKLLHEYSMFKNEFSKEEIMLLSEDDRNEIRFDPWLNLNKFKIEIKRWLDSLKPEV